MPVKGLTNFFPDATTVCLHCQSRWFTPPRIELEVREKVVGVFQNWGGTTGAVTNRRGTWGRSKVPISANEVLLSLLPV